MKPSGYPSFSVQTYHSPGWGWWLWSCLRALGSERGSVGRRVVGWAHILVEHLWVLVVLVLDVNLSQPLIFHPLTSQRSDLFHSLSLTYWVIKVRTNAVKVPSLFIILNYTHSLLFIFHLVFFLFILKDLYFLTLALSILVTCFLLLLTWPSTTS